ncbi:MAG: non-canonical purine NTP pyrophosphatase, partial [Parcubacteria group bacterium]
MKKLLIATGHPGKVREYKEIFKQLKLPVRLVSLKELKIKQKAEETGKTFRENAIIK